MHSCRQQGKKEYDQYLRSDRLYNLRQAHADILHDLKTLLILISLRDLLVVDDKDCLHKEQCTQEDAEEEQSAINGECFVSCSDLSAVVKSAFRMIVQISVKQRSTLLFLLFLVLVSVVQMNRFSAVIWIESNLLSVTIYLKTINLVLLK